MSPSKMRLLAFGVAAAGALTAGLLLNVGHDLRSGARLAAAEPADPAAKPAKAGSGVHVDAPGTQVDVDKERGKVSVTAPHTDVQVDPDKGRVQVRAPYVNLDIRW
jgi:hypothetical protein